MLIQKHTLRTFIILIGLFLIQPIIIAQSSRLYTMQDGLVSSHIKSITQDKEGFIWITSVDGLSRFDGKNFVTFKRNTDSEYSLRNNSVLTFFEDSQDSYWVGTKGGLHKFCRTENKFSHFFLQQIEERNELLAVSYILNDPNDKNNLIIGTSGYGVFKFNKSNNSKDNIWSAKINSYVNGFIDGMIIDKTNNLWICNNSTGIVCVDLSTDEKKEINYENLDNNDLLNWSNTETLVLDNNNVVFGGVKGLFIYETDKNQLRRFYNKKLKKLFCTSLYQQSDSILLVGTENMGLWKVNLYDEKAELWEPSNCPIELRYSKIRSIMLDDQDNLWLGIFQKGLLTIPKENNDFEYIAITDTRSAKNLACNTSFEEDLNGNLWVGTDGGGILVYKKNSNEILNRFNTDNSILESNAIMSLKVDNSGKMWIATYGGGMYCYSDNKITKPEELKILNTRIMIIEYDKNKNYIYAGTNGTGVWVYDIDNKRVYKLNNIDNSWIKSLFLDLNGNLWVGTAVSTYCMDIESEMLVNYNIDDVRYKMTNSYSEDADYIWFGTSEGLFGFNKKENKLKEYRKEDSNLVLNVQSVYSFNGNLWFATSETISKLDQKSGKIYTYNTYEVEKVGSFRYNSLSVINNNILIFGGDNGAVTVNCENFKIRPRLHRPVYLTSLIIQNHKIDYDPLLGSNNYLDASLWNAKNLNLPFDENSFIVEFSAQEYTNPMKVKYAYKLDGFEKDWHYMNADAPRANYSNVPPGSYKFIVRAFFDENFEEDSFKSIAINIAYPWYLKIWAKIIYVIIIFLLIYLIHVYLQSKRNRDNNLREIQQTERIKEAKLKLFTSISHEIRTPLTLIISPLKKLLDRENDENTKNIYELMYRNSTRILLMVNQLMDIRKIDNGQMKLHFKEVNMIDMLRNIMMHFSNVATVKNIDFTLENIGSDFLPIWADPLHFDKIFFNLLSNAFKFTPNAGKILLRVRCHNNSQNLFENKFIKEYVEINIFNEGPQISEKDLNCIFERFYQGNNNNDELGSGIGLDLAKQLTTMHHGKIDVRNVENRGVEFTVYIPLGNEFIPLEEMELENVNVLADEAVEKITEVTELFDDLKTQYVSSLNVTSINDLENTDKKSNYSILFVDDDEELCRYIKTELKEYNITVSNSGNSAWKKLLSNMVDVVVTDLRMPDGDGYEFCKRIKGNPDTDHIPVIVLTSEANESSEELAMSCQADRFLEKPVNLSLLRGAIGQALRIRENIMNKINRTDMSYDYDHMKVDSLDKKLIKKVTDVIRDNIENSDFSVEELSREVGISRVHLNRRLKEIIGMSPSSLIKVVRLKQAAYLLVNNKITISEVAYKVGFSSNSYFTNNFKSYFGMTPKEFICHYMENPDNETYKKMFEQ